MTLDPGKMIHRVELLQPPEPDNTDNMGQVVDEWTVVGTRWAQVRDLTGRRLVAAQQIHAEITVEVEMHYTRKVKPGMRLRVDGRLLEIIGKPADPTGLRRITLCRCREVV